MNPALVSIRGLTVRLGDSLILDHVDAELPRGKVTAVIGLNGAGKTTLLRALIKEIPYQGEVRFHCGHDHTHAQPRYVGYVPQRLRIENNLPLTVLDLFALSLGRWPLYFGLDRAFRERVRAQLATVGVDHLIDQICNSPPLSGGQLQRVLLALALEPHPELLLLDEPAQGIDFHSLEAFYDLIARLNQERGVTVVLVSHDVSMVSRVAHKVLCMKDRRIECSGAPTSILTGEVLSRVFGHETGLYVHKHD
jgi:zinc transport system ATP-binding protein